jgi:intermediate peptidase
MEHFLTSPRILALFGESAATTTDADAVTNHHKDPCHNIDTYGQILLAVLDQTYHSYAAMDPLFDLTAALVKLHDKRGIVPYVPGTSWQTQFGHLFGYGATYYSYLFDWAIAARVWRQLFAHNPLNREMGERYKKGMLRHDGGEDPWTMLGSLLGTPELAGGDERAMREVGQWRIEEEVAVPGHHVCSSIIRFINYHFQLNKKKPKMEIRDPKDQLRPVRIGFDVVLLNTLNLIDCNQYCQISALTVTGSSVFLQLS